MPNHCNNTLKLKNGENILNVINPYLIDKGDGDYDVDFNKIIPEPKDNENWYRWRVENWGTKWEGYDGRFNDEETEFTFSTAWSPPLPIIRQLAKLTGETLILEYIEEGVFFCGRYVTGKHGSYDEYYKDINEAPEELKDSLGYVHWEEEEEV